MGIRTQVKIYMLQHSCIISRHRNHWAAFPHIFCCGKMTITIVLREITNKGFGRVKYARVCSCFEVIILLELISFL